MLNWTLRERLSQQILFEFLTSLLMDLLVKADSKIALDVVVHDEAMLVELHTKKVLMLLIAWLIQESACRNVAKVLGFWPATIHQPPFTDWVFKPFSQNRWR